MLEWVMIGVAWLASIESCSFLVRMVPPSGTEVLVQATADSVRVDVSQGLRDKIRLGPDIQPTDTVWGQRFIVRDAFGLEEPPLGDTIVVVPWAYDSVCRSVPWMGSVVWVEPGRMAVFGPAFPLTPAEAPGPYHVRGWHQPYVDHVPMARPRGDDRGAAWLKAGDYFEFRRRIAADDPERAMAAVRAWLRERPDVAEMNPVRWYLREGGR